MNEKIDLEEELLQNEAVDNTSAQEGQIEEPEQPTEATLEEQLAELHDKYLRQVAEFDNFRKRTLKEKTELILNGGERVLKELLPVLDDMERALANIETAEDIAIVKEGTVLICQKFVKTLEAQGLKKMDTADVVFNTDYHEAIALIPAPTEEQKGKIIDCVNAGYTLNDRVLRHAKVAVGQ